jgi:hypothetical protein
MTEINERAASGLSPDELAAESVSALPDKEVVSILDLNADVDLAIDAASPIDLAAAANLNVAAPIDAAAGANILSFGSDAQAMGDQGVMLTQTLDADANATSTQVSGIDQSNDTIDGNSTIDGTTSGTTDGTTTDGALDGVTGTVDGVTGGTTGETVDGVTDTVDSTTGALTDGNLLNVNVNVDLDTDIAAPINGAVAANANVAAPINAGVAANVGSFDSDAIAVSQQDAIIEQSITGEANATADQDSEITQ